MAAVAARNCPAAEHSAAEVGAAELAVGGVVADAVAGGVDAPDAPPEQPTIAVNPKMVAAPSRTTTAKGRRPAGEA
jgi:hypothetical protein